MYASPLNTKSSLYGATRSGVWIGLPGVRLLRRGAGPTPGLAALKAFGDDPRTSDPMSPSDLIDALEKVLVERLWESAAARTGPLGAVRTAIDKMGMAVQRGPRMSTAAPRYPEAVNRLRSLPEQVRELLRRHYVFLEAEESICLSMNMTSKQFRDLKRQAADYVLMRRRFRREGRAPAAKGNE